MPESLGFPAAGDRIGRFRVVSQLGAGGMGVVYSAVEETLDRRVPLKVIAPTFADDAAFRQRFSREARALASLDSPRKDGTEDLDGRPVVRIVGEESDGDVVSYVSLAVPHYILRLESADGGGLDLSAFDEPLDAEAPEPSEVTDLSTLQ